MSNIRRNKQFPILCYYAWIYAMCIPWEWLWILWLFFLLSTVCGVVRADSNVRWPLRKFKPAAMLNIGTCSFIGPVSGTFIRMNFWLMITLLCFPRTLVPRIKLPWYFVSNWVAGTSLEYPAVWRWWTISSTIKKFALESSHLLPKEKNHSRFRKFSACFFLKENYSHAETINVESSNVRARPQGPTTRIDFAPP